MFGDDFLLTTEWAKKLYHEHAEKMPIIDYHCHLDPQQIFEDKRFSDISEVWLNDHGAGDHYKWRLLRAAGEPEKFITGECDPYDRFLAFCRTMERALGNPVYEWSQLELKRAFGIELPITEANAPEIWERANKVIAEPWFSARGLIRKFNVECLCTTDDPVSDLVWHKRIAEDIDDFKVLPTFRPDGLLEIGDAGFGAYIDKLVSASGINVTDWETLKAAAAQRVDYFAQVGGRMSDHGMNSFTFVSAPDSQIAQIVEKRLAGSELTEEEVGAYQTAMTLFLMGEYDKHGWVMQIHGNCFRNDSTVNLQAIGKDAGFDSVGAQPDFVYQLKALLDAAQQADGLPRLILYSLNNTDWLALSSLAGSFQGGCRQRVQFGNAWWFNDTFSGMKQQITMFAESSLLANFTGMLTDSRSLLSYPRHEYFRRILCHTIGEWIEQDRWPADEEVVGKIVEDISYRNAHDYFGFFDED